MSRQLRVVVACDAIGDLDSWAAGVAIAQGWADHAAVAVVPVADAGQPLGGALARLLGGDLVIDGEHWAVAGGDTLAVGTLAPASPDGWDPAASSAGLGRWLDRRLRETATPRRLVVDLTGQTALDGGAGLLAGLGAGGTGLVGGLAGLAGASGLSLDPVLARLQGVDVVAVAAADQTGLGLLGLQGAVAHRGFAARLDPAELLAAEASMTQWLGRLGLADGPGTGAAGGVAAAVRALGGRVVRGAALCAEVAGLDRTVDLADVVITGCTSFHIGNWGGEVVRYVADLAVAAERACLAFAVESSVSRREMRTFGIEAAYPTGIGPLPQVLTATAARVGRSWTALSEPRID